MFRIQQLKQLLEDSTSDDDGSSSSSSEDKEKHKKKKKKEKHKKKKKEKKKKKKRKHKSSKSNESSDSEWREPGLFNILFSQTRHCGQRWEDRGGRRGRRRTGETPGGRGCGVPGAGSHLPSREDASCASPGASSGHAWLQAGELFPLCSSLLIPVGPNSLEMPRAGRPDEGSLWGAPPRCCRRFNLQGGATCVELRPDFPLLLRIIKAHYLFFKCIYFFLNACTCSKFKRYLRFNYETSISFLPQLPSSLSQWLPVLPVSCDIFQEYCLHHKQA